MKTDDTRKAMQELTMILMYLSRFKSDVVFDEDDFYAWKGYDFDVINQLEDEDYIRQGSRPYKSKSVYLTKQGQDYAKQLMIKYGISDWK